MAGSSLLLIRDPSEVDVAQLAHCGMKGPQTVSECVMVIYSIHVSLLPVIKTQRDGPFGPRHFMTCEPTGVLLDIVTPTRPTREFATAHSPEADRP